MKVGFVLISAVVVVSFNFFNKQRHKAYTDEDFRFFSDINLFDC